MIDAPPGTAPWACYAQVRKHVHVATGFDPPHQADVKTVKLYRAVCACGWEHDLTRLSYGGAIVDCEEHVYGCE